MENRLIKLAQVNIAIARNLELLTMPLGPDSRAEAQQTLRSLIFARDNITKQLQLGGEQDRVMSI